MAGMEDFMPTPDDAHLKQVASMVEEVIDLRSTIDRLQARVKELAATEREISQTKLPEKMRELGLSDFTLESGEKVSIRHKVKASLSAAKREEGFEWLRENGFGDLIKSRVVEESVHAGTLSAFCKEQMEKGTPIPTSLFGVYEFDQTIIK